MATVLQKSFRVGDYVRIKSSVDNFGGMHGRVSRVGVSACEVWIEGCAGDCLPFMFEDLELVQRPTVLKAALTVSEAAQVVGVSRNKMYDLTRRPGFPAIRDGHRIIIPRDALLRWLDEEACRNSGEPYQGTQRW